MKRNRNTARQKIHISIWIKTVRVTFHAAWSGLIDGASVKPFVIGLYCIVPACQLNAWARGGVEGREEEGYKRHFGSMVEPEIFRQKGYDKTSIFCVHEAWNVRQRQKRIWVSNLFGSAFQSRWLHSMVRRGRGWVGKGNFPIRGKTVEALSIRLH